jgi:nitrate reductase delta subunit
MSMDDPIARIFHFFSALLEYPTLAIAQQVGTGMEWLAVAYPQAAARLYQFQQSVKEYPVERLEEIYTRTFDLQPVTYPYVGFHLFGESYKRGAFMAKLNEVYSSHGFSTGKELPDHVAVILRFLASEGESRTGEFGQTLLAEGLAPTLAIMAEALNSQVDNPYAFLISALSLVVEEIMAEEIIHV